MQPLTGRSRCTDCRTHSHNGRLRESRSGKAFGKGRFLVREYDPNIGSFYSDNAEELAGRLFLNLGAVNLVRMHGYTWSVELGDDLYGIILSGADAKILHSIERATAPLIQNRAREDVQDSVASDNGGCQTLHFAISVPLRRSCRCR